MAALLYYRTQDLFKSSSLYLNDDPPRPHSKFIQHHRRRLKKHHTKAHGYTPSTMELTMLLITTSITAGVYMTLFFAASMFAWIYYKRCKKLQKQLADRDPEAAAVEVNTARSSAQSARVAREERRRRRQREEGSGQLSDVPREGGEEFELRPLPLKPVKTRSVMEARDEGDVGGIREIGRIDEEREA